MINRPYKIGGAAAFLYDNGISFHAHGILRDKATGTALYDFYKTDFLTQSQENAIRAWCKKVEFRGAYAEYAPEIRGVYICFPKAAALKGGKK